MYFASLRRIKRRIKRGYSKEIRMKILFITHPFHKGQEKYKESHSLKILGLTKSLRELGHSVKIYQTEKLFPNIKGEYDVVHGFSGSAIKALRTWYVGHTKNAKTIHTINSIFPHFLGGYRFARLLNLVDITTVPLESMKTRLQEKGVKTTIQIIHSNIEVKKFKPKKVKKEKRFAEKPLVFYWGALWPEKGVNEILEAAKLLPDINFLFLPRYNIYYEIEKPHLFVLNNIFLLKNDESLTKYLNMCDIVVLPYRTLKKTDANPSCLLEAWANKKPVVTTDLEETRELGGQIGCQKFRIACFAEPDDPKDLAGSIQTAFKHSKETNKTIKNAYKYVQQFDTQIIAKQYEQLYNRIVNEQLYKEGIK